MSDVFRGVDCELLRGLWLLFILTLTATICQANPEVVTNHWYVQLHGTGGENVARTVAKRNGFSYVQPVSRYHFLKPDFFIFSLP